MSQVRTVPFALLLCTLGACADRDDAAHTAPATDDAPPAASASTAPGAVVRHMHLHAEQLDRLEDALSRGDLEAAATPAYWLSRHETLQGVPADWQPLLARMRAAAQVVEETTDLAAARSAAQRLATACDDCHRANDATVRVSQR